MADRTMNAPLAIIKVNGVAIGKMRTIRCTETIRGQLVKGIGQITRGENNVLDWTGNLNCGAYTIDLRKSVIPGAVPRLAQTAKEWEDTIVLMQDGFEIVILRKIQGTQLPSGIITPKFETFVTIKSCFARREDWDITEGQVSGRNADFEYNEPFLFPL